MSHKLILITNTVCVALHNLFSLTKLYCCPINEPAEDMFFILMNKDPIEQNWMPLCLKDSAELWMSWRCSPAKMFSF